jgi:hypothetical protein
LLLMFAGLWRARLIHVAFLGVYLLGALLISFTGKPHRRARLLRGLGGRAVAGHRLLLRPAGTSGESATQGANPVRQDAAHGSLT